MISLYNAIHIANEAHRGQVDKKGQPYILHALRVMMRLDTSREMALGVLHDILEDTPLSPDDLLNEGLPADIVAAAITLTHKKHEPYSEYIDRVKRDPLARKVKIADIHDNLDLRRIDNPTDDDLRRIRKYLLALHVLENDQQ